MGKIILIIFVLIIAVAVGAVVFLLAATGLVEVPILSSLLKTDKPVDLGIKTDPESFKGIVDEQGVTLTDPLNNYCLTCDIEYSDFTPMDIAVTSQEFSSYVQATNGSKGPLSQVQVKFGNNNTAELSAMVDTSEFGRSYKAPVYGKLSVNKASDNTIKIDIQNAKVGIVSFPDAIVQEAEKVLTNAINQHFSHSDFSIDELSINNGELNYSGNFARTISAN